MSYRRQALLMLGVYLVSCHGWDSISTGQELDSLKAYREASEKWEKDVVAFEKADQAVSADESTLLFLGSSSIRRWHETMAKDLAPWPVLGRGYGGAKFSDLAIYAPRLLAAHHPRGVVIYVGNDITGTDQDKAPEEVVRLFGVVVEAVKKQVPKAEIFLIEITPAPKRFDAWPKIQAANQQLKDFCQKDAKLHFIQTHASYLTADGQPMPELYVADRLHQNEEGYKIWSGIIRQELESVFGSPKPNSKSKAKVEAK